MVPLEGFEPSDSWLRRPAPIPLAEAYLVPRGRFELPAIRLTYVLNVVTLPIRPPGQIKQATFY